METIKCITFDKNAQDNLPEHIKIKMKADRENATIANKFEIQFSRNISPTEATKLWSPIVDLSLSLSKHLDGAFSRNRISNENVAKAVPNFMGIVASIADLQAPTFKKFSEMVKISS